MCLNFYTFVLLFCIFSIFAKPGPNFGKFDVLIDHMEMCKGPKRTDCTKWDMRVENKTMIIFTVTINQNVAPLKVKVVVSSNGKELVRLQMARVCENVFMKPLFISMFNATNRCVIQKGTYHYELNMVEVFRQYYGGEFFFGNAVFRTILYNDDCNFSCTTINVTFAPNKS